MNQCLGLKSCWHFFARWKMVSSTQPQRKPWRRYFKWSENCSLSKRIRQWGNTGSLLTMTVTIPWPLKVFCKAALTRSKMDSRFCLIKSCASIFLISKKTTDSLFRRSRWSVGARKRKWYKNLEWTSWFLSDLLDACVLFYMTYSSLVLKGLIRSFSHQVHALRSF